MEVKERATRETGLKNGFLKKKKVKLMPIDDRGMTLVTADKKNSIHKFSYDGAVRHYPLAMDERFNLRDPFDSDEERFWFEEYFNRNLSTTKNSWFYTEEAVVKITLDQNFNTNGYVLDLSDPEDSLRYKILKTQDDIAPSMDDVREKNLHHWKFVLVDSDYEDNTTANKRKFEAKAFIEFGRITDSKERMKDFLSIYQLNNKLLAEVPEDPTEDFLLKEVTKILDTDKKGFIESAKDPESDIKSLIIKGIQCGAIEKKGVNQFCFPGEPKYSFEEFINYVKIAKEQEDQDIHDVYVKLISRIGISDNIKKSNKSKGK